MFRIIQLVLPGNFRLTFPNLPGSSVEMAKRKNRKNEPEKILDSFSQERGVGRPWRARPSEVAGRSCNLRLQFDQIWEKVGTALLAAQTEEDVLNALDLAGQYWRN